MNDVHARAERLVESLKSRQEDRGFMADLRRGFNRDTEHKAWPHIAHWCDLTQDRARAIHVTVMSGFAHHPRHANVGNLGATLRAVAMGQGGQDGLKSFEARFRRLLNCATLQEVSQHIPTAIRVAAARDVPVDFVELYKDLWFWSDRDEGRNTKVRWASNYWSGGREEGSTEE